MIRDQRQLGASSSASGTGAHNLSPGKRTLTESLPHQRSDTPASGELTVGKRTWAGKANPSIASTVGAPRGAQLQLSISPQQMPTNIGTGKVEDKAIVIRRAMADQELGWSRAIVDAFEQTEPAARIVLQRLLEMEKIVDALPDFEATRLGTLGPLVAGQDRLNKKRAAYLQQIIDDFGERAEVFALFALRGVYDEDAYAIFAELADKRYLHKLLEMPEVAKQIKARGLKTGGFREPGAGVMGAARGVLCGIGDGIKRGLKDDRPGKYQWQKAQLPPEYEGALSQMEIAEFEGKLANNNPIVEAIDQITFGVPHGVVDLGHAAVSGIIDISSGDYRAGGEKLAGAAIVILTHLGVRAWRIARSNMRPTTPQGSEVKQSDNTPGLLGPEGPGQFTIPSFEGPITAEEARFGALLELNPEAQAAMGRLIARIGRGGVETVAEFVRSNSRAALFVTEYGEQGVYALLAANGDPALAVTRLPKRQLPAGAHGVPPEPGQSSAAGTKTPQVEAPVAQPMRDSTEEHTARSADRKAAEEAAKRHVHKGEIEESPLSAYKGKWNGSGVHDWDELVAICHRDGYHIKSIIENPVNGVRRVEIERTGIDPRTKTSVTGTIKKTIYPKDLTPEQIDEAGTKALKAAIEKAPGTKLDPYGTKLRRDGSPADGFFEASVIAGIPLRNVKIQGWFIETRQGDKVITSHAPAFDKNWPQIDPKDY